MSESKKPEFSAEEKAAMKERAKELKTAATKAEAEADVIAKIAKMSEPDRSIATRLHSLVKEVAPELSAKTWYGSPAWNRDGKTVLFFQDRAKFTTRYSTLGFSDAAMLDDGSMWPSSYAVLELGEKEEELVTKLLRKALD